MKFQKHQVLFFLIILGFVQFADAQNIRSSGNQVQKLNLRAKVPSKSETGEYTIKAETREWKTKETAIIICDMWDAHWCTGASERTAEMAPKMDSVVSIARNKGMLIVHSPGGCMEFYKGHPARNNAIKLKNSGWKETINSEKLQTEKNAKWPIDDSDGGCDCSPECKQHHPWKRQIERIQIHEQDLITDSGEELLSYFHSAGINKVILIGVHTNMCIINRPYGLRSIINAGIEAVLMRDLTDSMHDSKQWPYVSHFDGTRLMIDYIEKYICPTIVSSDLTQNTQFNFAGDLNN
jgi:nicotinamidase-related amidase